MSLSVRVCVCIEKSGKENPIYKRAKASGKRWQTKKIRERQAIESIEWVLIWKCYPSSCVCWLLGVKKRCFAVCMLYLFIHQSSSPMPNTRKYTHHKAQAFAFGSVSLLLLPLWQFDYSNFRTVPLSLISANVSHSPKNPIPPAHSTCMWSNTDRTYGVYVWARKDIYLFWCCDKQRVSDTVSKRKRRAKNVDPFFLSFSQYKWNLCRYVCSSPWFGLCVCFDVNGRILTEIVKIWA